MSTRNRKWFGTTRWSKDDIKTLCTDENGNPQLTDEQVEEFIALYEGTFEELIVERGWDTWQNLMSQYRFERSRSA